MPSQVAPPDRRASPSPSPPANPPTSSAPGRRAKALTDIFDLSLRHTMDKCTYENFASCFPTPAKHVPDALRGLHRDFVSRLDEMCRNEVASLLDERDVIRSLNELDLLIAEAKKRKEKATAASESESGGPTTPPTPPHLLPPEAILSAHLSPFLAEQTSIASTRLDMIQKANVTLADEISAQRQELDGLVQGFESSVRDLEGASDAFNQDQMQGVDDDLVEFANASS